MATIWGRVTRTNSGQNPYTATYEDGSNAGSFPSSAEAQTAIERAANTRLKWDVDFLAGDIESYVGFVP